jgi:DNA-directed RNA polymerase subunit A"
MTAYDVSDDIEALVEGTELPLRLRNELYSTLEERDVTTEQAKDIVQATVAKYEESRVDPLDPVGTVSAQSIGEPGTQMSVPYDERVIVRRGAETQVTEIGPLVDGLIHVREKQDIDGHEVTRAPDDLEVLSLRDDEQVEWKPVEEVSRHEAPDELLQFELESGRMVRATKSHSFVTRKDNEVVPVAGDELSEGDWLPVVGEFDGGDLTEVDLREHLSASEYWYTSSLTDGGVDAYPSGDYQLRNKRQALDAGEWFGRRSHTRLSHAKTTRWFPSQATS